MIRETFPLTLDEEEIAGHLRLLGMSLTSAKVLVYLDRECRNGKFPVDSRKIERDLDLRQPEVSIALHKLKDHLHVSEVKSESKGRPIKKYLLKENAVTEITANLRAIYVNAGEKVRTWARGSA